MAIATPLCTSCQETELWKRAAGYGIPGVLADGFNVLDVYAKVKEAVDRARAGGGPTLIECRFLRLLGHFVADDQWYRDLKAVEKYWELDPLKRMKEFLERSGTCGADELAAVEEKAKKAVEDAVDYAMNKCADPVEETLYDDIYAHGERIV
jgi:pyruvate dehydrogenase E1 component alpha subunit